jgi:hypothetical protein
MKLILVNYLRIFVNRDRYFYHFLLIVIFSYRMLFELFLYFIDCLFDLSYVIFVGLFIFINVLMVILIVILFIYLMLS